MEEFLVEGPRKSLTGNDLLERSRTNPMAATEAQTSRRSDSSSVAWRLAGHGPRTDRKLWRVSLLSQADREAINGGSSTSSSVVVVVFFRMGTVLERAFILEGLVSPNTLWELVVGSWQEPGSREATIAASARAFSRASIPIVALRWAGEGGWKDRLVDFQADRIELSSGPPKRTVVRLLVELVVIMVVECCLIDVVDFLLSI